MGIVATSDQTIGKLKSAISPSAMNMVQKTFRCMALF